jgi:hypothetical protein
VPCAGPLALWGQNKAKQNNTLCTALYIHVQIGIFEALGKIRGQIGGIGIGEGVRIAGVDTRVDRGSGAKSGIG